MASARGRTPKNKLNVASSSKVEEAPKPDRDYEAKERKYRAEEGLRSLNRAEEIKRDKSLMKDIKCLAKEQMKAVCK